MRTEEVLISGGVGSLTVVLVLLVSLSFRDRQRLRAEIQQRLAAFVTAHHVERPFVKRERDRADPEAMARGAPILRRRNDADE